MYEYAAIPVGRFASKLEAEWNRRFIAWGWKPQYVGNAKWTHDFEFDGGVCVEIKPPGERFVEMALLHSRSGPVLIIEGCRWWVAANNTAIQVACPSPASESPKEYMQRVLHAFTQ